VQNLSFSHKLQGWTTFALLTCIKGFFAIHFDTFRSLHHYKMKLSQILNFESSPKFHFFATKKNCKLHSAMHMSIKWSCQPYIQTFHTVEHKQNEVSKSFFLSDFVICQCIDAVESTAHVHAKEKMKTETTISKTYKL